jgi:hypothetical protein
MPDKPTDPPAWTKVSLPLPAKHQWKAKEGYQIFVADAGAVRFEFPHGWVIRHNKKDTITFHNKPQPDDEARISLTIFRLPMIPATWWKDLPMEKLMRDAVSKRDPREKAADIKAGEAVDPNNDDAAKDDIDAQTPSFEIQRRHGMELGWMEKRPWKDPENGKMIRCHQVLARGRRTQILITFDFYQDTGDRFVPVWEHLLKSLRLEAPVNLDGSGRN